MTLVKVNNRPFSNLFSDLLTEFPIAARSFGQELLAFPQTNVFDTPETYHLELNPPGRTKEDFKVKGENWMLTVSLEKKETPAQTEAYKTIRREFEFRSFKRSFSVDDKINTEGIQAKYEN